MRTVTCKMCIRDRSRAVHLTAPHIPGGEQLGHKTLAVVDHAGFEGEGVLLELVLRHSVLEQGLGGDADGVQPVSYTHLDVYKRQVQSVGQLGAIGLKAVLQLAALHVGEGLCAEAVQRVSVQRVETDEHHQRIAGILHGSGE